MSCYLYQNPKIQLNNHGTIVRYFNFIQKLHIQVYIYTYTHTYTYTYNKKYIFFLPLIINIESLINIKYMDNTVANPGGGAWAPPPPRNA